MNRFVQHFTKCLLAGVVAILPIGGLVLSVAYVELTISRSGISTLPFYFPGLGIISALVLIYLIGLVTTTVIGNWLWSRIDRLIDGLPLLGKLYASLKQILGYGKGETAMFRQTVLIPSLDKRCDEIGLVTNEVVMPDGARKLVVFIPGTPNPTFGRLLIAAPDEVKAIEMPTHEALKTLVAVGMTDVHLN